jgi:hypothetical protein
MTLYLRKPNRTEGREQAVSILTLEQHSRGSCSDMDVSEITVSSLSVRSQQWLCYEEKPTDFCMFTAHSFAVSHELERILQNLP